LGLPAEILETGLVVLRVNDAPPSLNTHATSHWRKYQQAKKQWGNHFDGALMLATAEGQLPARVERVKARFILTFYDRHKRDEGNFEWLTVKAFGDCLDGGRHTVLQPRYDDKKRRVVNSRVKVYPDGRWLADDNSDHYRTTSTTFVYADLPPRPEGVSRQAWRAQHPRGITEVRLRWWA
jgi:hypothetical protein